LGWGTDCALYRTVAEFREQFPKRLAKAGPRVLKQYRGQNGIGVWKVELLTAQTGIPGANSPVRVLEARRDSLEEDTSLGEFLDRCEIYFHGAGRLLDQPFQERLPDGMIRCYLSGGQVIGFTQQYIRGLLPAPAGSDPASLPQPGPRIMQPADEPIFAALRQHMEADWVPGMQRLLGIETANLPVLWDADFLFGPKDAGGRDSYVLCEINVSSIAPFPEFAAATVAKAALTRTRAFRQTRS
jgi:hypothetical protein